MAKDYSNWDESDVRVRANKKGSRPRTKDRPAYEEAIIGRIVTVDRGRYTAIIDENEPTERTLIAATGQGTAAQSRGGR